MKNARHYYIKYRINLESFIDLLMEDLESFLDNSTKINKKAVLSHFLEDCKQLGDSAFHKYCVDVVGIYTRHLTHA